MADAGGGERGGHDPPFQGVDVLSASTWDPVG